MAVYTAIDDPEAYFQVRAFTGNQGTLAVTLDGDTDMLPTMVWIKPRETASYGTKVWDSVRGATNYIETITDAAEGTGLSGVDSFDSDGFTLGSYRGANDSAGNIAWCWKESADAGFDIVTYTGTGSARTISHSLSAVPHFIIQKERNEASNWKVYHHKNTSAPETDYLTLNTTAATDDYADYWNDTAPTSSVYSIGSAADINGSSDTYVTYLWSEKQGFSKFGSYTGNGNADGTFVYTGFKPAYVLFKQTSASGEKWYIFDSKRNTFNLTNELLFTSDLAESVNTTGAPIDILSNGFKIRGTDAAGNASGSTYIYMAFAEAPFVNSNGVPCNAR